MVCPICGRNVPTPVKYTKRIGQDCEKKGDTTKCRVLEEEVLYICRECGAKKAETSLKGFGEGWPF